jgi:hypothetical protein
MSAETGASKLERAMDSYSNSRGQHVRYGEKI